MIKNLRTFLATPINIIVYSFENTKGEKFLYNAGSLQRVDPLTKIDGFVEIDGFVTDRFGVQPIVIGYDNNKLEIIYITPQILTSNGSVPPNKGKIVARSPILIPDMDKSVISEGCLIELPISKPNIDILTEVPKESPLEIRLHNLETIVKVLNQRLYDLPVECPTHLPMGERVISLDELREKTQDDKIIKYSLDPLLQCFAGSHRSKSRMVTISTEKGNTYLVVAGFDPRANVIFPAK